MRRPPVLAVASAAFLLANPLNVYQFPAERQEQILQDARALVNRHGHLIAAGQHPAELDRRATQRRRARQTHPGKRGKA